LPWYACLSLSLNCECNAHCYYQSMFNVCHLQLAGVDAVHDLHVWTLKPGVVMLTTHIVTTTHKPHLVLHDIEDYCKQHGIHHPTIQIEGKHHTHLSDEDVALIPSHHSTV